MQAHDCPPATLDISCLETFTSENALLKNFGQPCTLPLPTHTSLDSNLWTIIIHLWGKSQPGRIIACAKYFRMVKDSAKFPDKGCPVEISRNGESRWVYGVLKVQTDQTSWMCNAWKLVELSVKSSPAHTPAVILEKQQGFERGRTARRIQAMYPGFVGEDC
jgi:hypothetical protein